jgi:transketolase
MLSSKNNKELKQISKNLRIKVLELAKKTGGKGSHLGGTFSSIEIIVALYYAGILKFKKKNPKWPDRDRLFIGKGHIHLAMFNIWNDIGYISNSTLKTYGANGSKLGQQLNHKLPGSEYNTGSLGHVIGVGSGVALSAKLDKKKFTTYVLVGDAECDEGSIWEAVMFAANLNLNNLVVIVDRNRMSVMDHLEDDVNSANLSKKFKACGWSVNSIDGHNFKKIISAFKSVKKTKKPSVIIANTIKGKGVSFMEENIKWHSGIPSEKEYIQAMRELNAK